MQSKSHPPLTYPEVYLNITVARWEVKEKFNNHWLKTMIKSRIQPLFCKHRQGSLLDWWAPWVKLKEQHQQCIWPQHAYHWEQSVDSTERPCVERVWPTSRVIPHLPIGLWNKVKANRQCTSWTWQEVRQNKTYHYFPDVMRSVSSIQNAKLSRVDAVLLLICTKRRTNECNWMSQM